MIDITLLPNSSNLTVDLHCHPSIKPFGRAFPWNVNSPVPHERNSIWRYDPPTWLDRLINRLTLTRFSQVPFFISLMHHFYNHMGGHAQSFQELLPQEFNNR